MFTKNRVVTNVLGTDLLNKINDVDDKNDRKIDEKIDSEIVSRNARTSDNEVTNKDNLDDDDVAIIFIGIVKTRRIACILVTLVLTLDLVHITTTTTAVDSLLFDRFVV